VDVNGVDLDAFERFVCEMQTSVCADLEAIDGSDAARFTTDAWTRDGAGSGFGVTRVLEGGDVFEKAAANVSFIRGELSPARAAAMRRVHVSHVYTGPHTTPFAS
jgi:coproporphyrinogen III oxidase